jgi:hypothetical protein
MPPTPSPTGDVSDVALAEALAAELEALLAELETMAVSPILYSTVWYPGIN